MKKEATLSQLQKAVSKKSELTQKLHTIRKANEEFTKVYGDKTVQSIINTIKQTNDAIRKVEREKTYPSIITNCDMK